MRIRLLLIEISLIQNYNIQNAQGGVLPLLWPAYKPAKWDSSLSQIELVILHH
jgi:hypothetical protein